MADRTVRAIFEARVAGARKGMTDLAKDVAGAGKKVDDLTKDLKTLDSTKVKPEIDVQIDEAKKRLSALTKELGELKGMEASPEVSARIDEAKKRIAEVRAEIKGLNSQRADVRIDAAIEETKKRISEITLRLGELRTMEVTPEVTADIRAAQRSLREARGELRELNAARAEMRVDADTRPARQAVDDLADDVGDAGERGGVLAGYEMVKGILAALVAIPIVGTVVGIGKSVAEGIIAGVQEGLAIEADRDIFQAKTGLDEDTAARFGRAAGEAYANAWGESVAANLDVAALAMDAGIIDSDATDAAIENVIAKLTGITDLFDYDITMAVQAVGNAMKTGLVKDADQAFDLITKASQQVASDDLLDTLNEYSNQFVLLGLTGQQAFGLITQGAEAGARDTDKVADTLKEMGLRIREGTKPATDALKLLGLNSKDMVKAFQRGGPDAAKAIDKVFDALRRLEAKGGNTQAVIAALFGGPGEDLGAALYALDIDKATAALDGMDGAAGSADRALATMSDNTAAKMESAKRNVELAMNGIKGALAEAFGDDISGAADWIAKNRAPLMEFFLSVIDGTFEMGRAFLNFSADAQEAIADVIVGIADLIDSLPGDQSELKDSLYGVADGLRDGAKGIREDFIPALDEAQQKADDWAAPEILKARVHDATMAMNEDLDTFTDKVKATGGTVTINGDRLTAEQALKTLIENINSEDGTVTINGDKVPAEDALDEVMRSIDTAEGDITVGADPAKAEMKVRVLKGQISATEASMTVSANTDPAIAKLEALRRRYSSLNIRVAGVNSPGGLTAGTYHGGYTGVLPGRLAGGWVPGARAGYDNVLWPLYSGGRTLAQPLEGKEYVVNSRAAEIWGPVLEWMNGGGRPSAQTVTHDSRLMADVVNILTPSPGAFKREIRTAPYRAKARPR